SQAHACYQQGIEAGCTLEDVAVAMPGSKGHETLKVLTMAKDMGFIKKLDKDEDIYDEKYKEGILKMETAFGLTADGNISVSEWDSLEKAVYPGASGDHVKALLEKLCDLEYIDKLADDHTTYTSKMKKSVQKAEKALGLTEDGILTLDEQTVILDQEVAAPGAVSNVKVKVNKGDVTLSWSKVKDARYYTIFRDGKQIGRTESTKYTDKEAVMGEFHTYEVAANKYTCASKQKSWNHVYVEPSYESVSLKNIWAHSAASYIEVSGVRRQSQMWKGDDLIMLVYKKIDGTKYWMYLRFENYRTAWDWDNGGIAEQRGLDTISAKGRTDGYVKYAMDSSSRVVLDVESVKWTY
ncbi:MAG: hypothetical protein IJF65_06300, partial [Clostridia bacterium]|nr:hypothetical protein [Clostridia bacterium]